jgi:hypothetical protein
MNFVSADPHAWLYPIFARLRADVRFGLLSPAHQFSRLADEVEREAPTKAVTMREWSPAAKDAMIKWLSDVLTEIPNPTNEQELWRVRKGERELSCVAVYSPIGVDLRLMEGADFRRTQLVKDAMALPALEEGWKRALHERGWQAEGTAAASE